MKGLKTVYGHPVRDLENAVIVSHEEALRLYKVAKEGDKIRARFNLKPWIKEDYVPEEFRDA